MKRNNSESGQAIIFLVFAMIGLLGMTALAIDGGMAFSDRRDAQNAADAAALAGAGAIAMAIDDIDDFSCPLPHGIYAAGVNAAIASANENGYSISTHTSTLNYVTTECSGAINDRYVKVITHISKQTDTNLIHFVFSGDVVNNVTAEAEVLPRAVFAYGKAIVATNPDACSGNSNGMIFSGDIEVLVDGGGIYSNGCLGGNGSTLEVDVLNGGIGYGGILDTSHPDVFNPAPVNTASTIPDYALELDPPNCAALANDYGNVNINGEQNINPGRYTSIRLNAGTSKAIMAPGLYCLSGSPNAFVATGGEISAARGVTIYLENGGASIGGNVIAIMNAYDDAAYPSNPPGIDGVLFYMAPGNASIIDLVGNAESVFSGLIFAPDGDIVLSGDPNLVTCDPDTEPDCELPGVTFFTQLVANNVVITGNTNVNIDFQRDDAVTVPNVMELFK